MAERCLRVLTVRVTENLEERSESGVVGIIRHLMSSIDLALRDPCPRWKTIPLLILAGQIYVEVK